MTPLRSILALTAIAITMVVAGCKRQVDVVIPDSGQSPATPVTTTAAAATTRAAPDPVEPLATLSSGRGIAPMPVAGPTVKTGDAGAALPHPTGSALPTGLPTGVATLPTGMPTGLPTGVPTATSTQPPECEAAKLMRQLGRTSESETLRVKCVDKGGKDPFS